MSTYTSSTNLEIVRRGYPMISGTIENCILAQSAELLRYWGALRSSNAEAQQYKAVLQGSECAAKAPFIAYQLVLYYSDPMQCSAWDPRTPWDPGQPDRKACFDSVKPGKVCFDSSIYRFRFKYFRLFFTTSGEASIIWVKQVYYGGKSST